MTAADRLAVAAAGFGLAAALSSWNPIAAPFGLVVGLATVFIAARALRRGGRRALAAAGLALAILAIGASGLVLALTAGVGREPAGEAVVAGPGDAAIARELDEAANRTRAARDRARKELGELDGGTAPAPPRRDGPPPRRVR